MKIFNLYRIDSIYYLTRIEKPVFSNISQDAEEQANLVVEKSKQMLLKHIACLIGVNTISAFQLIGEFQGFPIGDALYSQEGNQNLTIFYCQTGYGYPWIILGTALSKQQFIDELFDDDELTSLHPTGEYFEIKVSYYTENDIKKDDYLF